MREAHFQLRRAHFCMSFRSQRTPSIELDNLTTMERAKKAFLSRPEYEPVLSGPDNDEDSVAESEYESAFQVSSFSWLEYTIFFILGIAMLWAWYG